jgi:pyruvate formate lyase activating enzyme
MSEIICPVCFHACHLKEGQTGLCRARRNKHGKSVCANYGRLTSLAMDPIEKKPFARFYPGSYILSAGSYGCNLACPFCQNSTISMTDEHTAYWREYSPEELCEAALQEPENLGLAFTYNEPLISFEYIMDCARILKPKGKKIVIVSNGTVSRSVLESLMPYVDAMNIDLKGSEEFYRNELGGSYAMSRDTITYVYDKCHLEVTTLLIPGKNDNEEFIEEEAAWLASLDDSIVLHLSRYFPRYHYDLPPTDIEIMKHLKEVAQKHLKYVYLGNV